MKMVNLFMSSHIETSVRSIVTIMTLEHFFSHIVFQYILKCNLFYKYIDINRFNIPLAHMLTCSREHVSMLTCSHAHVLTCSQQQQMGSKLVIDELPLSCMKNFCQRLYIHTSVRSIVTIMTLEHFSIQYLTCSLAHLLTCSQQQQMGSKLVIDELPLSCMKNFCQRLYIHTSVRSIVTIMTLEHFSIQYITCHMLTCSREHVSMLTCSREHAHMLTVAADEF